MVTANKQLVFLIKKMSFQMLKRFAISLKTKADKSQVADLCIGDFSIRSIWL